MISNHKATTKQPLTLDADQPDLFETHDDNNCLVSSEHEILTHDLDKNSLVHLLNNHNDLGTITIDDNGYCVFNHNKLSAPTRKTISITLLKNALRDKGFELQPGGFRLPINTLKRIQLSEVTKNG